MLWYYLYKQSGSLLPLTTVTVLRAWVLATRSSSSLHLCRKIKVNDFLLIHLWRRWRILLLWLNWLSQLSLSRLLNLLVKILLGHRLWFSFENLSWFLVCGGAVNQKSLEEFGRRRKHVVWVMEYDLLYYLGLDVSRIRSRVFDRGSPRISELLRKLMGRLLLAAYFSLKNLIWRRWCPGVSLLWRQREWPRLCLLILWRLKLLLFWVRWTCEGIL